MTPCPEQTSTAALCRRCRLVQDHDVHWAPRSSLLAAVIAKRLPCWEQQLCGLCLWSPKQHTATMTGAGGGCGATAASACRAAGVVPQRHLLCRAAPVHCRGGHPPHAARNRRLRRAPSSRPPTHLTVCCFCTSVGSAWYHAHFARTLIMVKFDHRNDQYICMLQWTKAVQVGSHLVECDVCYTAQDAVKHKASLCCADCVLTTAQAQRRCALATWRTSG